MNVSTSVISDLLHHRWAVPIVAELHKTGGGTKFITLVNRVGTARQTIARTLDALIDDGWVARNPGYGHPMRPEYILTPAGKRIGSPSARLLNVLRRLDVEDAALRKWPLAVTAAVADGAHRFNDIRHAVPSVTARALTIALKQLQDAALIERIVYDEYPPTVEYRLCTRAKSVADITRDLARAASAA